MLVKIFLILAILAGIAAAILGFTQVKPKIEELQSSLVDETKQRIAQTKRADKGERDRDKAIADFKAEQAAHQKTRGELATTKESLAAANDNIQKLNGQVSKLSADLLAAKQELNAWENLGIAVDKIKGMIASLAEEKRKNEMLEGEKKIFMQKIVSLNAQLDALLKPDSKEMEEEGLPLPTDLKGKVVAVDQKWNFVMLDVGRSQEAREGGNMLIYRDGKLIAKVKIQSVTENSSIATIMTGWKIVDVEAGDLALHRPVKRKVSP